MLYTAALACSVTCQLRGSNQMTTAAFHPMWPLYTSKFAFLGLQILPVLPAVARSPQLERLTYTADSPAALHAVVSALPALTRLASLSLTARAFAIPPETARLIGRLPLTSLRLDSAVSLVRSFPPKQAQGQVAHAARNIFLPCCLEDTLDYLPLLLSAVPCAS